MLVNRDENLLSDDSFRVEYAHAGSAKNYCLYFTFRSAAKAKAFFEMANNCGLPLEIVENQVIILSATENSRTGIAHSDYDYDVCLSFTSSVNVDNAHALIKFINANHANGRMTKYDYIEDYNDFFDLKYDNNIVLFNGWGQPFINHDFFQSQFSLVKRINQTGEFFRNSAYILFALKNLFDSSISHFPKELLQIIMYLVNATNIDPAIFKLNEMFPVPDKTIDKFKKTNCFVECDKSQKILYLLLSNNAEANQLFKRLNQNIPDLDIKIYHNEVWMRGTSTLWIHDRSLSDCVSRYENFYVKKDQKLFFQDSINLHVKTKDNDKLLIKCDDTSMDISIPIDNIRIRSDEELVIFAEIIYPIFEFIDNEMIARLKEGAKTKAISLINNACSLFGDNKSVISMDEKIKNMKIACLVNLKEQISEGLRIRTPLEDIITNWYLTILPETGSKTVYEIIHLDRENKSCVSTGTSECIDTLLKEFSEPCMNAFADADDAYKVQEKYYRYRQF